MQSMKSYLLVLLAVGSISCKDKPSEIRPAEAPADKVMTQEALVSRG
jgi:hypothetical protein